MVPVKIACDCGRLARVFPPTRHMCSCGAVRIVASDGEHQLTRNADKPSSDHIKGACMHRGEAIRTVGCSSCKGNVKVKVYQCDIHGECTIKKRAGRTKPHVCFGCDDWRQPE